MAMMILPKKLLALFISFTAFLAPINSIDAANKVPDKTTDVNVLALHRVTAMAKALAGMMVHAQSSFDTSTAKKYLLVRNLANLMHEAACTYQFPYTWDYNAGWLTWDAYKILKNSPEIIQSLLQSTPTKEPAKESDKDSANDDSDDEDIAELGPDKPSSAESAAPTPLKPEERTGLVKAISICSVMIQLIMDMGPKPGEIQRKVYNKEHEETYHRIFVGISSMARCIEELANNYQDKAQATVILAGMVYTLFQIIQDNNKFNQTRTS